MPSGTIRDLGLPERAVTALTRAGVTGIEDLAVLTRRDLAAITGLGRGSITAIRLIVPEPPTSVRSGSSPRNAPEQLAVPVGDPEPDPAEEESPAAPVMPSFESLRASRRRAAIDVLVPGPPPVPSTPAPAGPVRPPDYADLLRLGVHVARAVAGVPRALALCSLRGPVRCLGRLLGE
jgi:hypothetical protein